MSKAFAPIGTKLKKSDDASPIGFSTIEEVLSIDWAGRKTKTTDVTNMDSTNFYEEILPLTKNPGEISLELNYVPDATVQMALLADWDNRTLRTFRIVLPVKKGTAISYGYWQCDGYITDTSLKLPIEKQGTTSVKVTLTGQPTFTAGAEA